MENKIEPKIDSLLDKYLALNYPHFVSSQQQDTMGIKVSSELHSQMFNQLFLTISVTETQQAKDVYNSSLALDLLIQNKAALPLLVKAGFKIANQENWLLGNIANLGQIPSPDYVKKINYSNADNFEKLVRIFFKEKGVTDNFTEICKKALVDVESGNLFSIFLVVKEDKVRAAAGYVFSPKKEFGHINFVLTLDDTQGYEYDLINAVIHDSIILKIHKIILIKSGTLSKSEKLIDLGFELENIYLNLVK